LLCSIAVDAQPLTVVGVRLPSEFYGVCCGEGLLKGEEGCRKKTRTVAGTEQL
jgi:hypothetical protein